MGWSILWWVLAGCDVVPPSGNRGGPIRDLTLVSVVVEPPELVPGQTVRVSATVVDPTDRGFGLLVWSCVPRIEADPIATDVPCVEDDAGILPFVVPPGRAGARAWSLPSPIPEDAAAAEDPTVATSLLMALACAPGHCPARLATLARLVDDPTPDVERIRALLRQPSTWVGPAARADLHFVVRRFRVADGPLSRPNSNPQVLGPRELVVAPEGPTQLVLRVDDAEGDVMAVHPFTMGGRIRSPRVVTGGYVVFEYQPPLEADEDRIVIAFEEVDGRGAAVYQANVAL